MEETYLSVWYATPQKASSVIKMIVFDDRGSLVASPEGLAYSGKKFKIRIEDIIRLELTTQTLPWVTYLIVNAAAFLWIYLLFQDRPFNWEIFVPILVVGNLFGMLVGATTKWIRVDYRYADDREKSAYFADGSALGWGGIFGGTRRMFREIEKTIRHR